jgi:glucose-6-phosphate isomerase, archaeal
MKEVKTSGLPIFMDEETFALEFHDGLTCAGSGEKRAGQLRGLLYAEEGIDETEYCYVAYRDIAFEKDRALLQEHDFRYDITVIMPGTVQGECKKTSGHYHGYIEAQPYTYPEVYEVLEGKALYVMQKVKNFDKEYEEPVIEDLKAVIVDAGQAVIIPPFYGHCSVNVGSGSLAFSNIAVVSCPLHYEPIQKKHGLSVYALRDKDELALIPNPHYLDIPAVNSIRPQENTALGITFGKPVYEAFIRDPQKFDFLLNPAPYESEILRMLI